MECPFCSDTARLKKSGNNFYGFALRDTHPVTEGHTLIVPHRHVEDIFSLHDDERHALFELLDESKEELLRNDNTITGFNIGINMGADAGQTIEHLHIHLIPRRHGDTEDPRGGVRGVIPAKQHYP